MDEDLVVPRSASELQAYVERFFAEYDELGRQMQTGLRADPGPVPSDLIFNLLDEGQEEDAWQLVAVLVDAAPSSEALGFVAASVLEDLVCHTRVSDRVYREILERARVNGRLKEALGMMYWGGREPDWFRSGIAALGVVIA
jgi:hypothetical protein